MIAGDDFATRADLVHRLVESYAGPENAELARAVARVTTTPGQTGWRISVDELVGPERTTVYAVVPIIGGRLDGRPVYRGSLVDCHRFYDLLVGDRVHLRRDPTLRSAPHSVACASALAGSAEGGAVRTAVAHDVPVPGSRTPARPSAGRLKGVTDTDSAPEVERDAGSTGASLDTHSGPGIKPSGVTAIRSSDAPAVSSSDGDAAGSAPGIASASPGPKRCAACGRDLSSLPPSPMAARRTTCSDACRQAYRRGHRAPAPGVVDVESVERLVTADHRFLSGFGRGDPDPAPDPRQLAMPLNSSSDSAPTDPGRARPSARVLIS